MTDLEEGRRLLAAMRAEEKNTSAHEPRPAYVAWVVWARNNAEAMLDEAVRTNAVADAPFARKYTAPRGEAPAWAVASALLNPGSRILVSCAADRYVLALDEAISLLHALSPNSVDRTYRAHAHREIRLRDDGRIVFLGKSNHGYSQDWMLISEES